MTWFDDGSRVRVYVSTAGDFVSLGVRTEYPFTNPSAGVPSGWSFWAEVGSQSDVYMTVSNGKWTCQNVSTSDPHNGGKYNIVRDFTIDRVNYDYIMEVQSSTMLGRSAAYRGALYSPNNVGGPYGTLNVARAEWEQIAIPMVSLGDTWFMRVYLKANPYWADPAEAKTDWGVQFQNFAIVAVPKVLTPPTWEEVTCDVQRCDTRYGRARFTGRYDVAEASLTIRNDDGQFNYNPNPEAGGFRPGRFIRVTATPPGSSTEYPLYYGVIDSVANEYSLEGRAVVNLSCVDTTSLLSNTNVPTINSESQTLTSGQRIAYLYRSVAWHANMALVDSGQYMQQGIYANGRSVRDEMGLTADSEGSYLYCDRLGRLIYRDRTAPSRISEWNTVQAELLAECPDDTLPVVDDIPTVSNPPQVLLGSLGSNWSRDRIINELLLGNQGGVAMSFVNDDSRKRYGPRTYQRVDFVNVNSTPSYLIERAADLMEGFGDAILRVNSVDFRPTGDGWVWALTVFLNDVVRVRYTNRLANWGYGVVSHVQQVSHSIRPDGWRVTLLLDQPEAFSTWQQAPGLGWDEGIWDESRWDGAQTAVWNIETEWDDGVSVWS